ncbi:MAG: hypothetical protein ACR2M1_08305 [Gemmatimonadaceae bacterium]
MPFPVREKLEAQPVGSFEVALKPRAYSARGDEVVVPWNSVLAAESVPADLPDFSPDVAGRKRPAIVLALEVVVKAPVQFCGDEAEYVSPHVARS